MNKKILILLVSLVLLGSSCTKFLGVDEPEQRLCGTAKTSFTCGPE